MDRKGSESGRYSVRKLQRALDRSTLGTNDGQPVSSRYPLELRFQLKKEFLKRRAFAAMTTKRPSGAEP